MQGVPIFGGYGRSNAGKDKQEILPVHAKDVFKGYLEC
ncbi:Uncharacterised protein [Klebsiella quasipneumoniae]|nr:Uncharacterised protein [Klebsiella quasipneumoniae]